MHGSLVAVAGAVGVGVISWYLEQIRKDRIVPRSQSRRLEHHAGRDVARPTRTLGTTPSIFGATLRGHSRQFSPPHDRAEPCRGDFVTVTQWK